MAQRKNILVQRNQNFPNKRLLLLLIYFLFRFYKANNIYFENPDKFYYLVKNLGKVIDAFVSPAIVILKYIKYRS